MRAVSARLAALWRSGDFTGVNAAARRVTVQQAKVGLHNVGYNLYSSIIFGAPTIPQELPNVKGVKWKRGVSVDVATCTVLLYNVAPQHPGDPLTSDLDEPGFYTPTRGDGISGARWQQVRNRYHHLLLPDNIIRTYEGYGMDPTVVPEADPNLMQTGVWIIDDVNVRTDGTIEISCSDLGRILTQQVIFPPVVPHDFYPLSFTTTPQHPGLIAPTVHTYTVNVAGDYDPNHPPPADWIGPTNPCASVTGSAGDGSITANWSPPAVTLPVANNTTRGYIIAGYQVIVDNVRLPAVYPPTASTATLTAAHNIANGLTYQVTVVPVYQETLTPAGEIHFGTNLLRREVGSQATPVLVHPGVAGQPVATAGAIAINVDPDNAVVAGAVSFSYTGQASNTIWTLIAWNGTTSRVYRLTADGTSSGRRSFFTGRDLGNLTGWSLYVYPQDSLRTDAPSGTVVGTLPLIGKGDAFFPGGGTARFLGAPPGGVPPHDPGTPQPGSAIISPNGRIPLMSTPTLLSLADSSNRYQVGSNDASVYGHYPKDACDYNNNTYWLSAGHERNDGRHDCEWVEFAIPNLILCQFRFRTVGYNYHAYISVFARGTWVSYHPGDVIPFHSNDPSQHNHANIPFVSSYVVAGSEGTHTITMPTPINGVTRIRLTLANLQNLFPTVGAPFTWRAGVREVAAYVPEFTTPQPGQIITTTTTNITPPAAPVLGPIEDDDHPNIVKSYQVYTPATVIPGAGEDPGKFSDYSDIVKLLCAWGGFFWPPDAVITRSDGKRSLYSFGETPYGTPNIDPVLGTDAGRLWGDIMQTGTGAAAPIPVDQWDKKALLDGITTVRNIIGFLLFIDEEGAVVWRAPNITDVGNYVGNRAASVGRTKQMVTIDEKQTIIELTQKISGANLREFTFVATTDGKTGAVATGYNPNPIGLRRVGGYSDEHFASVAECRMMADFIAIQQMFTYHADTVTVSGYPAIQIDDQVQIFERLSGEQYVHRVTDIQSDNDTETGVWTYALTTHWMGERPGQLWAMDALLLAEETQLFLDAITIPATQVLPVAP